MIVSLPDHLAAIVYLGFKAVVNFIGLIHQGQVCMSGSRVYIPRTIYPDFVDLIGTMKAGDPLDHGTDLGPLISRSQQQKILGYIEQGLKQGTRPLNLGHQLSGPPFEKGFWVAPTIFVDAGHDMVIAREEIFGPVIALIPYDDEDAAVQMANDTPYGLTAGVWGADIERANNLAQRLRAGTVFINDWPMFNPNFPFGGYKQSGLGRESGLEGLFEFTKSRPCASISNAPGRKVSGFSFSWVRPEFVFGFAWLYLKRMDVVLISMGMGTIALAGLVKAVMSKLGYWREAHKYLEE